MNARHPDPSRLVSQAFKLFPHLARSRLTLVEGGWVNWVFAGGGYVLKTPRTKRNWSNLAKEACVLQALGGELDSRVPQPLALLNARSRIHPPILVCNRVAGSTLANANSYTDEEMAVISSKLIRMLERIHASKGYVKCGRRVPRFNPGSWKAMQRRRLVSMMRHAEHLIPPPLRRLVVDDVSAWCGPGGITGFQPAFIHGDIDPRNILVDSKLNIGLIDWGDCMVGDPAFDYAGLFFDRRLGEEALRFGKSRPEADFAGRMSFYRRVSPLYTVEYGLRLHQPAMVRAGVDRLAEEYRKEL